MEDVIQSRGLYRITSRKEIEHDDDNKRIKWANKCVEARGLTGMSISNDFVKLAATRKVFLHACVLACRRLKLGNQLYLIYFSYAYFGK